MPRHRPRTRSVFQPKIILCCSVILLIFVTISFTRSYQLDLEDALFLTKNSLKEFKEQYLPNGFRHGDKGDDDDDFEEMVTNRKSVLSTFDLDYPFNNVMNSVFPIDSLIELNVTGTIDDHDDEDPDTAQIIGRYASFSPLINNQLVGPYAVFPNDACDVINASDYQHLQHKVLVVLRGGCTFVHKVSNIINSELNPITIIIGNDEPYRSLITMYSNSFNEDGSLRIPIMFITNEDYKLLRDFESNDYELTISTASLDNWMNLLISMTLSPPILILLFYLGIKFLQGFRRQRINRLNEKIVRILPVYIFNDNHLIPTKHFYEYLTLTGQTESLPAINSSSSSSAASLDENLIETSSLSNKTSSSRSSLNNYVINGVDLQSPRVQSLGILTARNDYYATFKCSICLEKFRPLQSRVILLDCKHIYHEKCLSNWLVNFKRSCPLCNKVLKSSSLPYYELSPSVYGSVDDGDFDSDLEAQDSLPEINRAPSNSLYSLPTQSTPLLAAQNPSAPTLSSSYSSTLMPQPLSPSTFYSATQSPTVQSPTNPATSVPSNSSTFSDTSFVTAHSRGPSKYAGTPFKYARPLQILSQYSGADSDSRTELSSSIDSTLSDEFATPAASLNESPTSVNTDDTIDDLTPNLSSVSTIEAPYEQGDHEQT